MSKSRSGAHFAIASSAALVAARLAFWLFPWQAPAQTMPDSAGITVDPGGALMHRAPVFYQGAATGSVTVEATLNGKGEVSDARVLGGPDELRKPSLQSVLQWHYSTDAGVSSPVHVTITFAGPPASTSVRYVLPRTLPAPPTPPTVTKIEFAGVPAEVEKKLRASLPLREGDALTPETLRRIREMAQGIDEHFLVSTFNNGAPTETTLRFTLGFVGAPAGGIPGGVVGGVASGVIAAAPPPPPPPAQPTASSQQRIRVSGRVQEANAISKVTPEYPPLARQARIQGVVRFTVIIGKDGTVQNVQLVTGHPLLVPAAMEAVKQYIYKPTLLNGQPVEVITQVDVNFTLAQ